MSRELTCAFVAHMPPTGNGIEEQCHHTETNCSQDVLSHPEGCLLVQCHALKQYITPHYAYQRYLSIQKLG